MRKIEFYFLGRLKPEFDYLDSQELPFLHRMTIHNRFQMNMLDTNLLFSATILPKVKFQKIAQKCQSAENILCSFCVGEPRDKQRRHHLDMLHCFLWYQHNDYHYRLSLVACSRKFDQLLPL